MSDKQTPDAVREALERRKAVNAILAPLLAPFVPDMGELIRIGNEACTAILAALDSRAGDAGEGLQSAVADALNAAWALCDDTENGDSEQPSVPRDAWKRLADALDALEATIPKSEQPCWPGVSARLLASATPAPAVDAVPAGEVERPLNRDDLYRFMDALKLSEKRDVAKAIGFDPAPLPGENDMDRWKRMWAWAAENDKKVELATAIRAALSHGVGRK